MKIKESKLGDNKKVEIKAELSTSEYEQLYGYLDNLHVFESEVLTEHSSVIKTGARDRRVHYFLFPSHLRKRFPTDDFDFEKLTCGTLFNKANLYVIYKVPLKNLTKKVVPDKK